MDIVACPHCGESMSVRDEHLGTEVLCPSCAGALLFSRESGPAQRVGAKLSIYIPRPLQVACSAFGILMCSGLFAIDTPNPQKIADLQKDYDKSVALRDRWRGFADGADFLSQETTGYDRVQMTIDAVRGRHNEREAAQRVDELAAEIAVARSTGRPLWIFGFCASALLLLHGLWRYRRKTFDASSEHTSNETVDGLVFLDCGERYRIKLRLSDGPILSKEDLVSDSRLAQVYSFGAYSADLTVFGNRETFQKAQQDFVTPLETIPELVKSPIDDSAFVLGGIRIHHFIGMHNPGLS